MRDFLRSNSLSIVVVALFLLFLAAQTVSGFHANNEERQEHGEPPMGYAEYVTSGHSLEATFENWESEFFQMGFYVVLTVFLRQRGSSESKGFGKEPVDADPRRHAKDPGAPGPVRRGGWRLRLYEHSLSLAFLLLFLGSFIGHAVSGLAHQNDERAQHGLPPEGLADYMASSQFWFESFQNWQSEFLAVAAIVVLSIYLRERGSPESKPVAAPHSQTGSE